MLVVASTKSARLNGRISRARTHRQPSSGATWVTTLSITWAL